MRFVQENIQCYAVYIFKFFDKKLIEIAGVKAEIVVDPARYRAVDIPDAFGSSDKAHKEFGWKPRIDLEGTLHSLFAYWLEFLG